MPSDLKKSSDGELLSTQKSVFKIGVEPVRVSWRVRKNRKPRERKEDHHIWTFG
jgi:hypothetical protein